jgi:hypothetical protein
VAEQEKTVSLNTPITWKSLVRIGLVWAAEYAMLALIEDAPAVVKIATIFCALGALATLEFEGWLSRKRQGLFAASIVTLTETYLGFLAYAGVHVIHRWEARAGLERIYIASGELLNRPFPTTVAQVGTDDYAHTEHTFFVDVSKWEKNSADWIGRNLGETARDRFLDPSGHVSPHWSGEAQEFNRAMDILYRNRKNLSVIIESGAYYRD